MILTIPYNKQKDKNWGYVNFLQMKDLLLIPVFEIDEDKEAVAQFHHIFPSYSSKNQIETINANCISWNVI